MKTVLHPLLQLPLLTFLPTQFQMHPKLFLRLLALDIPSGDGPKLMMTSLSALNKMPELVTPGKPLVNVFIVTQTAARLGGIG